MATTNAKIRVKRDTRANWTSNNPTLALGQLGHVTDDKVTKVGDGSTAFSSLGGHAVRRTILLSTVSAGAAAAVATGAVRGAVYIAPFAGAVVGWRIVAVPITGQSTGSCTLDVWKKAATGGLPSGSDTITASAKPSLSSAVEGSSTTLTGWTVTFAQGDKFTFEVESVTNLAEIYLELWVEAR